MKSGTQQPDDSDDQMVRGAMHTHSMLSKYADRINTIESFLFGLIDKLIENGDLSSKSLYQQVEKIKSELHQKNEHLHPNLALLAEETVNTNQPPVNCEERMHICKAVCCRMNFALSKNEVESGKIKWDLGRPYFIRKQANGYCCHNGEKHGCGIYADRPLVCQAYSCKGDERIWKDFDQMVLNEEWIDANLEGGLPS
jgi:Fe-S-cluster containining protein